MEKPEINPEKTGKKDRKKMKLWVKILIWLAAVGVFLIAVAFAFIYDGFGWVSAMLDWQAQLPEDIVLDTSLSGKYVTGENDYIYIRVSQEKSPYLDVQEYIDHYFDRFIHSTEYQQANGITVTRHETDGMMHITTIEIDGMPEGLEDTYTYVTLRTYSRYFFRAIMKYDSDYKIQEAQAAVDTFIDTFTSKISKRDQNIETDFKPVLPENWSQETYDAYERLSSAQEPYFGAFSGDMEGLQSKLGHSLPIVLEYFHLNQPFPLEDMEKAYDQGKLVELTLQCTVNNNTELYTRSALLAVLSGEYDEQLRQMAVSAAEFGHPFLFRLNNEMNSDWTSYSGIVTLSDPDLYVAAWRYIYDIFEEEGVNNAIWVFNPNDNDYPPASWNSFLAYYPGDEYVQVIGVTGYNTGTYYADVTNEKWKSFTDIYDEIQEAFGECFGEFPWIITEFASSSVGGDKAAWIEEMFAHIGDYENIKAAVWFDSADYDYRPGLEDVAARPYWIAETEETLQAFKAGLEGTPERFF